MKNNDKNVDCSSQTLSKEIKHDSPMIQDLYTVSDIIQTPILRTPEKFKNNPDIEKQLEGNDSSEVPSTQGEIKEK